MVVKNPRMVELLNIRGTRMMTDQEMTELIIEDKIRLGQPHDKELDKIAYPKVKPMPKVEEKPVKRKVRLYTDDELDGLYRQEEIDILLRYGIDKKEIPNLEADRIDMIKRLQKE